MFTLTDIMDIEPFSLEHQEKADLYLHALSDLTKHHYAGCFQYKRILDILGFKLGQIKCVGDFPFLPVRLFKEFDLLSVDQSNVVKTMTSSGTMGQSVSKIFLDKETASNQIRVLTTLVSSFIGKKRMPMLVIDSRTVIKDRYLFSARGAGILGFSLFGYDVTYALDDQMQIDIPLIQAFVEKHKDEPILLFGFTFMIWEHFYKALKTAGIKLALDDGIMIHGGGWKMLIEQAVDNVIFKKSVLDVCCVSRIYNYYGMVEQTGSIFMECEFEHLHASIYSDVLIRDHRNFSSLPVGQEGLVQLLSLLPLSYPGHSILTEDLGKVLGEDDCPCGRKGKFIKIFGRIKNAEVRGCSDTYAIGA